VGGQAHGTGKSDSRNKITEEAEIRWSVESCNPPTAPPIAPAGGELSWQAGSFGSGIGLPEQVPYFRSSFRRLAHLCPACSGGVGRASAPKQLVAAYDTHPPFTIVDVTKPLHSNTPLEDCNHISKTTHHRISPLHQNKNLQPRFQSPARLEQISDTAPVLPRRSRIVGSSPPRMLCLLGVKRAIDQSCRERSVIDVGTGIAGVAEARQLNHVSGADRPHQRCWPVGSSRQRSTRRKDRQD
jgi:hypothetical protein